MLPGVLAFGSTSRFHASDVWPEMPPGAADSAIRTATGTSASPASRPRPAMRRVCSDGGRRLVTKPTARPAAVRSASSTSSSAPSSCPASTRAAIGARSVVSPSCAKAHSTSGVDARADATSAATARRRSGTAANQIAAPIPSAISEPREYESIRHTSTRPSSGHASTLSTVAPERRAASHSSGGTETAAISPTLFQYSNGARRRASSSSEASAAGKILVRSAHAQTTTVPAITP